MKVCILGCGALGGFYGAHLRRSGLDVVFLLRSDYEIVLERGFHIQSARGDFTVHPRCAKDPEMVGPCDLVVIGLKTTANDQLPRLLPPLLGPGTLVLTLQNGLGNEAQLASICPPDNLLGGLCFVCLVRTAPGTVRHLDHGLVVLGEYQRPAGERTRALVQLFERAGIPCRATDNLEQAHWEKLIWNIPFNGLGAASAAGYEAVIRGRLPASQSLLPCLSAADLLADPAWFDLTRALMNEVLLAAQNLGFGIHGSLPEEMLAKTRTMGAYKASTVIDFEQGRPIELDALFLEPLRQARAAGLRLPRLEALCSVLQSLTETRANAAAPASR